MIDEFGDCAGMPDTYRGWAISYEHTPIPWCSTYWLATGPNYGAPREDMGNGWIDISEYALAATREELIAKIDAWILDNGQ